MYSIKLPVNSVPIDACLLLQTVVLGVLMTGGLMMTGREDHQKEDPGRGKGVSGGDTRGDVHGVTYNVYV